MAALDAVTCDFLNAVDAKASCINMVVESAGKSMYISRQEIVWTVSLTPSGWHRLCSMRSILIFNQASQDTQKLSDPSQDAQEHEDLSTDAGLSPQVGFHLPQLVVTRLMAGQSVMVNCLFPNNAS